MKRRAWIFGAAFAIYAVLLSVAWVVGTRQAREKTEGQLDYAVGDMRISLNGVIDTLLEHLASIAVHHFKKPAVYSMEEVAAVAEAFDIDEINVVDREGRIVATNDPDCLGVDMKVKAVTRPFVELTNGVTRVVSQPFRRHAYGTSRRKYLGVPFPDGNGYVQVGLDESRMDRMISSQLAFLFDPQVGDTLCYLCADMKTGALVSAHFEDGMAKTLDEIGFDASKSPGAGKPLPEERVVETEKTFVQTLQGRPVFCRDFIFGGHRFIIVEPKAEFFGTRDIILATMAILLFVVLGTFAFFIDRVFRDAECLKRFYAAEEERRARDMNIAKTVQNAALPATLPESPFYGIYASMQAAKDVGGDFYDYFNLDATHVAFLVADVSGKGITAALYMMTAKTIIKDTLIASEDPAAALTKANAELCARNPANMFLSVWVGVLDLETGVVTYANAGHNPPVVIKDAPQFVAGRSGPVLAFMDGVSYKSMTLSLLPGDALFLYTDGVTEALDSKNELFGEDRLTDALKTVASLGPHSICMVVRAAVAAFSEGVPQADDITVLAVRYVARPKVLVRSFPPTQAGISSASDFLDEVLADIGTLALSPLHIILDEVCSNIVKHSDATVFELDISSNGGETTLTFVDDGSPYDPLSHEDPDTSLPAGERPIGGLGIMMVKKLASSVTYRRTHNRNFLIVKRSS